MVHEIYGSRQMLPGHRNRNNPPSTQPTVMVPASKMGFKKKTVCLLCLKCFFHHNENFDGLLFLMDLNLCLFQMLPPKSGATKTVKCQISVVMIWRGGSFRQRVIHFAGRRRERNPENGLFSGTQWSWSGTAWTTRTASKI